MREVLFWVSVTIVGVWLYRTLIYITNQIPFWWCRRKHKQYHKKTPHTDINVRIDDWYDEVLCCKCGESWKQYSDGVVRTE